MEKATRCSHW